LPPVGERLIEQQQTRACRERESFVIAAAYAGFATPLGKLRENVVADEVPERQEGVER
jgi:hypothetical protein